MSDENSIDMAEVDDSTIANVNQRPNGIPENWIVNWGPRVNYERNYDFSGTLQDEVAGGGFDFTFARSISAGLGTERNMERLELYSGQNLSDDFDLCNLPAT